MNLFPFDFGPVNLVGCSTTVNWCEGSTPALPHLLGHFNLSSKGTRTNYIADDIYRDVKEHAVSLCVVRFECKWEDIKNRYMHAACKTRPTAGKTRPGRDQNPTGRRQNLTDLPATLDRADRKSRSATGKTRPGRQQNSTGHRQIPIWGWSIYQAHT